MDEEVFFSRGGAGQRQNLLGGAGKGSKSAGRGGAGAGIINTVIINSPKDDIWDMDKLK